MKIIIYATHSYGTFDELKKNKDVIILGYGDKWEGFIKRNKVILEYINKLPDNEIISIIDGFDSFIKNKENAETIENVFKSMDCGVLMSKEEKNGMNKYLPKFLSNYIRKRVFGICKDDLTANFGLSIGYVKYYKILLNIVIKSDYSDDDQRNLNFSCKKLPFLKIDDNNIIFENCDSKECVSKTNAYITQLPGELSFQRLLRALSEYPQFFLPEIIMFVIFITLIFYYGFRKKTSRRT